MSEEDTQPIQMDQMTETKQSNSDNKMEIDQSESMTTESIKDDEMHVSSELKDDKHQEFNVKDNQNMKRKHKNHSKLLEMIDKEFLLNFDYSSQNVDQLPYIFLVSSKH
jgi:hypothetical protein